MDNCHVESNAIVAAGAVLLEGTKVESWSIYAGVPAKKVKTLSKDLFKKERSKESQKIISNILLGLNKKSDPFGSLSKNLKS